MNNPKPSSGKKAVNKIQEVADHLKAQIEKEIAAKKTENLFFPQVSPEVKETFSQTNCDLLINLPFQCCDTVINAHKNELSSSEKSILVHTFEEEQLIVQSLVTKLPQMCVGIDPEYRFEFFREFEKWFENLEHVFKKLLFRQITFKSDMEFTRFNIMVQSQFLEMEKNLLKLLNRFTVMNCATGEKWEYAVKALENIGAIPQGTLQSMLDVEAEAEELHKHEKELESTINILSGKIRRLTLVKEPPAKGLGRPRKYSDDTLKSGCKAYEQFYENIKDSKGAWSKVAELINAPTYDAARKACTNYKKKLEKST